MTNIVRAPLWLPQLFTGAKSFRANPILGSRRLNRMGLHAFRRRVADRMGAQRRQRLGGGLSAMERDAFDRDGFVVRYRALDDGLFRSLRREADHLKVVARE